jgi:hypothetical protein
MIDAKAKDSSNNKKDLELRNNKNLLELKAKN